MTNALLYSFLFKAGSIVLLLGGLIFVHELGHFVAAKALGVKVVRFAIGFGPRLFGIRRGETEYRIAALPLGGYVKMAGDDPAEPLAPEDRGRGFLEQRPWRRFVIAAAGPAMNLLFPAVIYFAIGMAQNGKLVPAPRVGALAPFAPAAVAGLRPGDRILSVATPGGAAKKVRYFADLRDLVSPHPGEPLVFEVERDGRRLPPITITPAPEPESNPLETTVRGVIGVMPAYTPAVVAPTRPGAAGPLEPFDLVVAVDGERVAHALDLERALERAHCAPVDLEVLREEPLSAPGAPLSTYRIVRLEQVPTCLGASPTLAVADPGVSTFVAKVAPDSPAERAGLVRGDAIAAVNGKAVGSFRDINARGAEFKAGQKVRLTLADGRTLTLVPAEKEEVDEITRERHPRLDLGFFPDQRALVEPSALLVEKVPYEVGPLEAAQAALKNLREVVRLTVIGIVRIATGKISFQTVGGPIMLFSIAAQAAVEGLESFLFKMALISVNLGLMNLLPIPVLDGGHLAA
ncbi:MAG TPA: RIP metalloprotease RseP, partial [Anaeromyxobacteraceae bacterium]|nr:RIP metalloprotease RseP [Anaeromyxobacteraceae bacterium]